MTDTFLVRRLTLASLWERFREDVPSEVHLLGVVFMFYLASASRERFSNTCSVEGIGDVADNLVISLDQPIVINPLVWSALVAVAVLFMGMRVLKELGVPKGRTLLWAAITGVATAWWPSVQASDGNILVTFILMAVLWLGVRWHSRPRSYHVPMAIALMVFGVMIDLHMICMVPAIVWFIDRRSSDRGRSSYTYGLLVVATSILFFSLTPHHPQRDIWQTMTRIWSILVAPGSSILLYSPILFLFYGGLRKIWEYDRRIGILMLGMVAGILFPLIVEMQPSPPPFWGSRTTAFLVPLLTLPVAFVFLERKAMSMILVGAGFIIQIIGVSFDYDMVFAAIQKLEHSKSHDVSVRIEQMIYHPDVSPLRIGGVLLRETLGGHTSDDTIQVALGREGRDGTLFIPIQVARIDWWFFRVNGSWSLFGRIVMGLLFLGCTTALVTTHRTANW